MDGGDWAEGRREGGRSGALNHFAALQQLLKSLFAALSRIRDNAENMLQKIVIMTEAEWQPLMIVRACVHARQPHAARTTGFLLLVREVKTRPT